MDSRFGQRKQGLGMPGYIMHSIMEISDPRLSAPGYRISKWTWGMPLWGDFSSGSVGDLSATTPCFRRSCGDGLRLGSTGDPHALDPRGWLEWRGWHGWIPDSGVAQPGGKAAVKRD